MLRKRELPNQKLKMSENLNTPHRDIDTENTIEKLKDIKTRLGRSNMHSVRFRKDEGVVRAMKGRKYMEIVAEKSQN